MITSRYQHTQNRSRIIAADLPPRISDCSLESLLSAFRTVANEQPDVMLVLARKRHPEDTYSVWNYLDAHGLVDRVDFFPYYDRCERFPIKKRDCNVWVSRSMVAEELTADYLRRRLAGELPPPPKYALFFTSFHPSKQEGNSRLMSLWLDHLKMAGYLVHVVYYMYDVKDVTSEMRRQAFLNYDLYVEVDVVSKLTGRNRNGLNVHVDDWCGTEALDAVERLTSQFEYDVAVTNYPFMTGIFQRVSGYTKKILLAHDCFADRNRKMLSQGYSEAGWVSLDESGEHLACERSDVTVVLQEEEAAHFRKLVDDVDKVVTIPPLVPRRDLVPSVRHGILRIGYFGSSNWVNEQNIGEYIRLWSDNPELVSRSEILVGGGVCDTLAEVVPGIFSGKAAPKLLGRFVDPQDFYCQCDLIINPERGGTGIKIKTLEAMAYGMPVLTTSTGSVGLGSSNRFHQARDFEELLQLTTEVAVDDTVLAALREATFALFDAYFIKHRDRLSALLGPAIRETDKIRVSNPTDSICSPDPQVIIPDYVKEMAADYHIEEFSRFLKRIDIRGKRILEIGSDYHLCTARLFHANGAQEVIATNIGNWRSDEPLPSGITFEVCDIAHGDFTCKEFDIAYGIAVLEHIPDLEGVCSALQRLLRPHGIVYLQGCPLWVGSLGHHVYYSESSSSIHEELYATGGGHRAEPVLYSFAVPAKNPIPDWAHLSLAPDDLTNLLVCTGVPAQHAAGISVQVFNLDGVMRGSCSNFLAASEILGVLGKHFEIECERITSAGEENDYYREARKRYSEEDLRTLGLKVWMRPKRTLEGRIAAESVPKVSIIVPFYNVEPYIRECLQSVVNQDYPNLEILLIDDASPDESRRIVEQFALKDSRIRLITHSKNRGLGPARNTGAHCATGVYFMFLDSDDLLSTRRAVTLLVAKAQETGCKVVVGSCQRVLPDGRFADFDRGFDKQYGGTPDEIVEGEAAYLGASFIPGGQYVPMRAWGTLIEREFYIGSRLHYPPSEHEDLAHTPFLYYCADKVLYLSEIVVNYRERENSLSTGPWSAAISQRYARMWRQTKATLERFSLQRHLGNTAVMTADHMVMRLGRNGLEQDAEAAAVGTLAEILSNAKGELDESLLFRTIDRLHAIFNFRVDDSALHRQLTCGIDPKAMVAYYRNRLKGGFVDYGVVPLLPAFSRSPCLSDCDVASKLRDTMENTSFVDRMMDDYRRGPEKELGSFPSMLTEGDKALYYHAAKHCRFDGAIVDAGCFVGATTMSLIRGLMDNPRLGKHGSERKKIVRVYDLFRIDDDYILKHLKSMDSGISFQPQGSFLDVFRKNLAGHEGLLDIRSGDITGIGYPDRDDIEILGVDLCKTLSVTDFVVREFFPRMIPDALVIHQDFIHEYHPYIHISMMKLHDCFQKYVEIKWGGSVAYRCIKPVTSEIIDARFGCDTYWFANVDENAALLRALEADMLYDENRWVILLTLGVYYHMNNRPDQARAVYEEARVRFPGFHPSEPTQNLFLE